MSSIAVGSTEAETLNLSGSFVVEERAEASNGANIAAKAGSGTGTASGTFTSCTGGNYSFGNSGDATGGKFYFCSGGTDSFSGTGGPTIGYCLGNGVPYP